MDSEEKEEKEDEHGHEHGRMHDHGGPDGPHRGHEFPPHLMREIMDMKEKIGRLEGMMEVLMKKM